MGYPPGGRGYRVRDIKTNHFYHTTNVVFDENIPYRPAHSVPSSPTDYSSLPFLPSVLKNSASKSFPPSSSSASNSGPELSASPIPAPSPSLEFSPPFHLEPPTASPPPAPSRLPPRSSSRERRPTEKGALQAKLIQAQKEHLQKVRERSRERSSERSASTLVLDDENPFANLCHNGVFDTTVSSVDSAYSAASLDVEEYLARDIDITCEAALLSVRSDARRNPRSPGYDLAIPPATYEEAMLRSDAHEWQKVVDAELAMLKSMGVYVDEELPAGRKAIGNRWVFEFKIPEDGSPPIYKGRLVAHGFSQIPFVDYGPTFAPVAKSVSVRVIAVYSAAQGWHLDCFDATRAFLWGDLSEVIFMRRPKGYSGGTQSGVWRLKKSLYGLKQASRVWYRLFRSVLERLGFVRSEFDHAVFIFRRSWNDDRVHCLLAIHVDDGIAGCNSKVFLTFIKGEIGKAFGIKDLGPVKTFLGVQFERNLVTRELWIHQEAYIDALLEEYGLVGCNPVSTPLDAIHPFGRPTDVYPDVPNLTQSFQRLLGSILFLQRFSRADISDAVLLLSHHCSKPLLRHYAAAKRLLRYLSGTRSLRLHYGGVDKDRALAGFTDADWAGDKLTRTSVSGFVWFLAGGPISWSSKSQTCVATSSTESEYVALTCAIQEGLWLRTSLSQLHIPTPSSLVISTDNEGARSLSENDSSHSKAKHIDIRYHFIRSHVESGTVSVVHTPGVSNPADILTKPLSRGKFVDGVQRLGFVVR